MQEYLEFASRHPVLISLFSAILLLIIIGEVRRKAGNTKPLTAVAATQLINTSDCLVLDVRAKADYKAGHIIGAEHLNFSDIKEKGERLSQDQDKAMIVYCQNGTQAPAAAQQLRLLGYTQVYTLAGGIAAWQADAMPLEK